MTPHLTLIPNADRLLRRALFGNALFSGASGLAFAVTSGPIAVFLGLPWPWALIVVGIGLLGYAAQLIFTARQPVIDRHKALAFVAMDGLWVVGSAILLAGGWVPLTAAGKWAILIVAAIVALFAVLQYYGLRRISRMERA